MNMYNNKRGSDVQIITSEGIIYAHSAYLYQSHVFTNLLDRECEGGLSEKHTCSQCGHNTVKIDLKIAFPHFDEYSIILYIKYLYNYCNPYMEPYERFVNFLNFVDFTSDDFNLDIDKIRVLQILLDNSIEDNIYKMIIKKVGFSKIKFAIEENKLFIDEKSRETGYFDKLFSRLSQYNIRFSDDIEYIVTRYQNDISHGTTISRFIEYCILNKTENINEYQKSYIERFIDRLSIYSPSYRVIFQQKFIDPINPYGLKYLLSKQQPGDYEIFIPHSSSSYYATTLIHLNYYIPIADPHYFSKIGFTVYLQTYDI